MSPSTKYWIFLILCAFGAGWLLCYFTTPQNGAGHLSSEKLLAKSPAPIIEQVKSLQRDVGAVPDGIIGPETIRKAKELSPPFHIIFMQL
jgi:hypothetical protein